MRLAGFLLVMFFCQGLSAQNYTEVDAFAQSVTFSQDYKDKAVELTENYTSELDKARAIFSWIAFNISYDERRYNSVVSSGGTSKVRIEANTQEELDLKIEEMIEGFIQDALKKQKGVCQDFAYLYKAMAKHIGMECEFVTGFGRFDPTQIGKEKIASNHAWNAIKIDDEWTLMDLTWSTGMGQSNDLGEGFFKVDPELFILSHFPDDDQWQLLDESLDAKAFSNQAFMFPAYLVYGVQNHSPNTRRIDKKGLFSIEMKLASDQFLVVIKGQNVQPDLFESRGDIHTLAIEKHRISGPIIIGIVDGRSVEPLMSFVVN